MSTRGAPPQTTKNTGKGNGKAKSSTKITHNRAKTKTRTGAGADNNNNNNNNSHINTEEAGDDDEDEENDPDFVPTAPGAADESGSGSEASDSDDGPGTGRGAKKAKLAVVDERLPADLEEARRRKEETRQRLWDEFQASISTPPPPRKASEPPKTVKIVKRYRFAGEDVSKVEEVPENSADAKKWPLWNPVKHAALDKPAPHLPIHTPFSPSPTASSLGTPQPPSSTSTPNADTTTTTTTAATQSTAAAAATTTTPAASMKPPRPGPRRARKSLDAMFADANAKAKKLSTLDKSAMDWKEHVESDASKEIREDLEANRRGGGFLEKVAFLQRVEERTEAVREEAVGRKRRRG
ncbi:bucentaur or craniofacial development-domain-containing protein [Hysterangium stoloniferum]|nr:bucentaur or craniofacial development-domain-containing protein [Hysterangium stoloniferum]